MKPWKAVLAGVILAVSLPVPSVAGRPPVAVVADIGWSVNPYHAVFRRPGWTEAPSIPGFPATAVSLPLTLGSDYATSRAADTTLWNTYQAGTLYWIPGTNLLLLTNRPTGVPPDGSQTGDAAGFDHGTATAGVLAECADCYVLFIQDNRSLDGDPVRRIVDEMPWVDVVVSTNLPGDPISDSPRLAEQTLRLHQSGRIFVAASGNDVVTGVIASTLVWPMYHYNLPPWVVSVGGAYPECNGTDIRSAKPAELAGHFAPVLARAQTIHGAGRAIGTSFAAPQVARGFAEVLQAVRAARGDTRQQGVLWAGAPLGSGVLSDGRLSAEEIRTVAREAARWFFPTGYTSACAEDADLMLHGALPAPAGVPWVEMGWGYFGSEEAAGAARIILEDLGTTKRAPRAVRVLARAYLSNMMAAREAIYPFLSYAHGFVDEVY